LFSWRHYIWKRRIYIYIIGNPTTEEIQKLENYRQYRIARRNIQVFNEIERTHELKIERIRAEAIITNADYLDYIAKRRDRAITDSGKTTVNNSNNVDVETNTTALGGNVGEIINNNVNNNKNTITIK